VTNLEYPPISLAVVVGYSVKFDGKSVVFTFNASASKTASSLGALSTTPSVITCEIIPVLNTLHFRIYLLPLSSS